MENMFWLLLTKLAYPLGCLLGVINCGGGIFNAPI